MMKRIVVKLGGSSLQNLGTLQELIALVSGLRKSGYEVIVVHGGGPAINAELLARGIQWKFINGQRQTTPEMMGVIDEVLAGKVNTMVVNALRSAELPAVGMSGAEERTLFCSQASTELMQVGKVEAVSTALIEKILAMENAPLPVIAPLGVGECQEKFNINADWAAAKIAVALKAEKLIFLTDQKGLLDEAGFLVRQISPSGIHQMIENGVISGGMYTKVMTMMMALDFGVQQVRVLNANEASLLLVDHGIGTLLVDEKNTVHKDATAWMSKMS